jgi:DNA-binding CsgD family transcriptional regulator
VSILETWDREGSLELAANRALRTHPERAITRRQLDVLTAMSRGLSYGEAAAELGIGIESVKEHLKRARDRLGARNTNQAIARAVRRGLIP